MHARVACIILRDAAPIEQGDWQSVTCAETVCVNTAARGRAALSREWTTHLFAVGTNLPYKNDAAAVERRVVMFEALAATPEKVQTVSDLLCEHADIVLQAAVRAYSSAVRSHGDRGVWEDNIFPPVLHEARQRLRELTNPLHSCLCSGDFEHNAAMYMPLSMFKELYQDYRHRRGLHPQRWVRDHWYATFQELRLTTERGQREYNGTKTTCEWLIGVDSKGVVQRPESVLIDAHVLDELREELCRAETEQVCARTRYATASRIFAVEAEMHELKVERARLRQEYLTLVAATS